MIVALVENRLSRAAAAKLRSRMAGEPVLRRAMAEFLETVRGTGYADTLHTARADAGGLFAGLRNLLVVPRLPVWQWPVAAAALLLLGLGGLYGLFQTGGGPAAGALHPVAINDVDMDAGRSHALEETVKGADVRVARAAILRPVQGIFGAAPAPEPEDDFGFADTGLATQLYTKTAPSVLFLQTKGGFATGFVAGESGLIVTNEHVAKNARVDEKGRLYLNAVVGRLDPETGFMRVTDQTARAFVVEMDAARDLAVLRVDRDSPGAEALLLLPPLPLRESGAPLRPLEDVFLIGNAGSGFLWSIKQGAVQQVAPYGEVALALNELNELLERRGAVLDSDRERIIEEFTGGMAKTRVIEASTASAQGDSGGPLLDIAGRVVGVCSGSRRTHGDDTSRYYYIHADELRAFLESAITAGGVMTTDEGAGLLDNPYDLAPDISHWYSLALGRTWTLVAVEGDGKIGALFVGKDEDGDTCVVALAEEVTPGLRMLLQEDDATRGEGESLPRGIALSFEMDFFWASQFWEDVYYAGYNTSGAGIDRFHIDTDYDGMTDVVVTRTPGGETVSEPGAALPVLSLDYLHDPAWRRVHADMHGRIREVMEYLSAF